MRNLIMSKKERERIMKKFYFAFMLLFSAQVIAMEKLPGRVIVAWENKPKPPPSIFAWHLDAIYENPKPWELRASAIKELYSVLSKKKSLAVSYLTKPAEANYFVTEALKLAQSIPGTTNVIRALIKSPLNKYCDWDEEDEQALSEYAIQPVPNLKMILLIQLLKKFRIRSIGIGNQDPMEHDIFVKKLQTGHNIRLYDLFARVLGIPFISVPRIPQAFKPGDEWVPLLGASKPEQGFCGAPYALLSW